MAIRLKRQGGLDACSKEAVAPTSLKYGEPAIDSAGTLYIGTGDGGVKKIGSQLYTGTFTLNSWISTGGYYTQTQSVAPVGGGNAMTADMMLGIPQSTQTDDRTVNENKQEALGFFAAGKCTPGDGKITIKCWEKPVCDVDVYWEVK